MNCRCCHRWLYIFFPCVASYQHSLLHPIRKSWSSGDNGKQRATSQHALSTCTKRPKKCNENLLLLRGCTGWLVVNNVPYNPVPINVNEEHMKYLLERSVHYFSVSQVDFFKNENWKHIDITIWNQYLCTQTSMYCASTISMLPNNLCWSPKKSH